MSKGGEDKEKHTVFHRGLPFEEVASRGGTRDSINCELCGSQASLYCQADDAYLCRKCDKWVHKANFLTFRHVRCFLCKTCQNLTQRYLIGASVEVVLPPMVSLYGPLLQMGNCYQDQREKVKYKRSKGN